jgi:hypothetical protein
VSRALIVAIVATALGLLRYALIFVTHFLPVIQLEQYILYGRRTLEITTIVLLYIATIVPEH